MLKIIRGNDLGRTIGEGILHAYENQNSKKSFIKTIIPAKLNDDDFKNEMIFHHFSLIYNDVQFKEQKELDAKFDEFVKKSVDSDGILVLSDESDPYGIASRINLTNEIISIYASGYNDDLIVLFDPEVDNESITLHQGRELEKFYNELNHILENQEIKNTIYLININEEHSLDNVGAEAVIVENYKTGEIKPIKVYTVLLYLDNETITVLTFMDGKTEIDVKRSIQLGYKQLLKDHNLKIEKAFIYDTTYHSIADNCLCCVMLPEEIVTKDEEVNEPVEVVETEVVDTETK